MYDTNLHVRNVIKTFSFSNSLQKCTLSEGWIKTIRAQPYLRSISLFYAIVFRLHFWQSLRLLRCAGALRLDNRKVLLVLFFLFYD